jgi:hypothetical protein
MMRDTDTDHQGKKDDDEIDMLQKRLAKIEEEIATFGERMGCGVFYLRLKREKERDNLLKKIEKLGQKKIDRT